MTALQKTCSKCFVRQPAMNFALRSAKEGTRRPYCRSCGNKMRSEFSKTHRTQERMTKSLYAKRPEVREQRNDKLRLQRALKMAAARRTGKR